MVAGLFLLIGAVLGFVFNRSNDKRKAQLEAEVRWHEIVRTLSAAVFAHGQRLKDISLEDYELGKEMDDSIPMKARLAASLRAERKELVNKMSELTIIVPKTFTKALFEYTYDAIKSSDYEAAGREAAVGRLSDSSTALMKEVRKYLGLPGATAE